MIRDCYVKYQFLAECKTPMRTGSADGNNESLLMDSNGFYIVQGATIAGALREWVAREYSEDDAENLFGSQENEGSLIISDAIFGDMTQTVLRPRLKTDAHYGCAEDGKKFDERHIETGSRMNFSVVWRGNEECINQIALIENAFGAIQAGDIRFGANKGIGFGIINLKVCKQEYHLRNENDRRDWLDDIERMNPIEIKPYKSQERVYFIVKGNIKEVLVKQGFSEIQKDTNAITFAVNMKENGRPVIPGSSIKGVIRARVQMIADYLRWDENIVEEMFGATATNNRTGKCGLVQFEDIMLDEKYMQIISRIRINKFTGGVIKKALFHEEPVSSNMELRITSPNRAEYCMLLLYTLRDLGLKLYGFGSGSSIGRGLMDVKTIKVEAANGKNVELTFLKNGEIQFNDPEGVIDAWSEQIQEVVSE